MKLSYKIEAKIANRAGTLHWLRFLAIGSLWKKYVTVTTEEFPSVDRFSYIEVSL